MTFSSNGKIFTIPQAASQIEQIKTGDFNGDGHLDIAVAHINWTGWSDSSQPQIPSDFQVLLGDGRGNFSDQTKLLFNGTVPSISYVPRMIVADFNGDGISDVFGIDNGEDKYPWSGGYNKLFLSSNGKMVDASLSLPQVKANNHGASVGDVNNDGRLDILANALMNEGNDLQIQDRSGRFVSTPSLMPELTMTYPNKWVGPQTNTWSALIDVNNNGYVDMILGAWDGGANRSQVFLNQNGSLAKSTSTYLPSSGIEKEIILDVQPIDLNGDKFVDLALSVTNGGDFSEFYKIPYVQLLVNDGSGGFVDETSVRYNQNKNINTVEQSWYKSIAVVDFNNDGHFDMLLDNPHQTSKVLLNDGSGKFNEAASITGRTTEAVGDVNNDGMVDIISAQTVGQLDSYEIFFNTLPNNHIYRVNFGGSNLVGSNSDDKFYNNNFSSSVSFIDGGSGDDTVSYGELNKYTIKNNSDGRVSVSGNGINDTLLNIERLEFANNEIYPLAKSGVEVRIAEPTATKKNYFLLNMPAQDNDIIATFTILEDKSTATANQDYKPLTEAITIKAGTTSYAWGYDVLADNLAEPEETIVCQVTIELVGAPSVTLQNTHYIEAN